MNDLIRIVIADDHPIVRQGLRMTIEADRYLRVVGEAGDGRAALEMIEKHNPQIAVLDVDMPEMDGFAVVRALNEKSANVEKVFLTIHRDEDIFNEAINLGVKGYVLKDSAVAEIVHCVKAVAEGNHYASAALTSFLFNRSRRTLDLTEQQPGISDLTPTERRVLRLIAEYKTSREIAAELFVSPRTIETHRTNISNKLDLHGSHALVKFAIAHLEELRIKN